MAIKFLTIMLDIPIISNQIKPNLVDLQFDLQISIWRSGKTII